MCPTAMQVADLPILPGPPHVDLKRRILDAFLQNPFLDDDLSGLALRLDVNRFELVQALEDLCQMRFLKEAGQRRYLLDLDFVVESEPVDEPVLVEDENLLTLPGEALVAQHTAVEVAPEVEVGELIESLPGGMVLWRADGTLVLANQWAVEWLGIPLEELEADRFAKVTGFHPNLVLGGVEVVHFSLKEPHAIEVSMHACCLAEETAVLAILRDSSLQEEIAQAQTILHEQLFACLDEELVDPLLAIQDFLESPAPDQLGRARAALEQINGFLEDFLLAKRRADKER